MVEEQIPPTIDCSLQPVKNETFEELPESTIEAEDHTDANIETLEEEVYEEEEHLYEDLEEDYQEDQVATVDDQAIDEEALQETGEAAEQVHDSSSNQVKSEIRFDSEEEEVDTAPKYVFSWKELYNPKKSKAPPPTRKILEYLPKPNFVPHTCYVCNTSYEDSDGLDTHLEEHVDMLPYKCETCATEQIPQQFKTLITLNKHMQSHFYPYQCDFCPIRLLTMPTYEEHMRRYHGYQQQTDGFTCDYCGRHFLNKKLFKDHYMKHVYLEQGKYKCEYCGRIFTNNALLKRHRRTHTGEKPFECKKCGKKFSHSDNYKNHMRAHINEKGYVCSECGKSFINSTYLRYHMAHHFPDDPQYRSQAKNVTHPNISQGVDRKKATSAEKVFLCQFEGCNYVTTTYSSYFYHKSMHEKKFHCELCHKRFHMNHALQKHIVAVHKGVQPEKTLACQYCGKLFSSRQKLNVHIDVHENNRRHKCRYCEKTFVQKSNLSAHERIHTGDRPYRCRVCSAQFVTSSGQIKHEKTHQQEGGAQLQPEEADYEYEELEEVMEEDSAADAEMVEFAP